MGRNEDSLLRAAGEHALASATRGGSCTHPDQSRGLVHRHKRRAISGVGASSPILLFFLGGGVALHERLVGKDIEHILLIIFTTQAQKHSNRLLSHEKLLEV